MFFFVNSEYAMCSEDLHFHLVCGVPLFLHAIIYYIPEIVKNLTNNFLPSASSNIRVPSVRSSFRYRSTLRRVKFRVAPAYRLNGFLSRKQRSITITSSPDCTATAQLHDASVFVSHFWYSAWIYKNNFQFTSYMYIGHIYDFLIHLHRIKYTM